MRRVSTGLGLLALAGVACSSGTTPTTVTDGGADASESSTPTFTQKGRIVDFDSAKGVAGVTVTATATGGVYTATTDATGNYLLAVPQNVPYTMSIAADQYLKLIEQEWSLTGDATRGDTRFVSIQTQSFLQSLLTGYDPKLAVVSVGLTKLPSCTATLDGVTLALETPGASVVKYFKGAFPNGPSVSEGASPSALFYNVTPGTPIKLVVTGTTCKLAAFPRTDVTAATISYTGNIVTEAGNAASYGRFFLE